MMEIDMHSPPATFRPLAFAIKRPRSPGSPTQERQTKRLSLAPVGLEGQCGRRASTVPEGVVANKDDWVRQAKELSIASPVIGGFPVVADGGAALGQSRADEYMAVDDESPLHRAHVHPGSSRPWTTKAHLPLIHITTTPAQASVPGLHASSPAPFSVLTEPPESSSTESASSTSSTSLPQTGARPPDIFLFPATPSDTPSHQHQFGASYGQQAAGEGDSGTHARVQERIEGWSRPARASDMPVSGRKHRVTMGPRADCVKCRTGVRGHWMHFD